MKHAIRRTFSIVTVISCIALGGLFSVPSAVAAPSTYVVNVTTDEGDANVGDSVCETSNTGECTLRAAIEEANSNVDADTIEFNIPGTGVHTISPVLDLPAISEPVTIDGYSQPGSVENTAVSPLPLNSIPTINLQGPGSGTGLSIQADDSMVHGLIIQHYTFAIIIDGDNTSVTGSYIQTSTDGLATDDNFTGDGIAFTETSLNSELGGADPQDRNILGASPGSIALFLVGQGGYVYGNYIGIGRDGITDLGVGINIMFGSQLNGNGPDAGTDETIGGPLPGQVNLISGADTTQMNLVASNNVIQGNIVGGDYTGHANDAITNGAGIGVGPGATGTIIGGTASGEGNILINVNGGAIMVFAFDFQSVPLTLTSTDVAILGNTISDIGVFDYYGFGDSNTGIDLLAAVYVAPATGPPDYFALQGPTPNDTDDVDSGPNGLMNAPELTSAQQMGSDLNIVFDLDSAGSSSDYRVEFFSNDTSTIFGHGPGQTYLGSIDVDPGTDLVATLDLDSLDVTGKSLSATATAKSTTTDSGFGSTSEFSQNIEVGTAVDFDADGISDSTEDSAPNNGDGNNDGILDKIQPTVSSYLVGSIPVTFVTNGCSANGSVSSLSASSLAADGSFSYPYGLTDFTLNCSRGDTATITKYVFDNTTDALGDYSVRKYRPGTQTYEAVSGSSVARETVGSTEALVMSYSLQDGGALDDDGEANGIIVDPVGLAHVLTSSQSANQPSSTATGTLSNTGASVLVNQLSFATAILAIGIMMTISARKKFCRT